MIHAVGVRTVTRVADGAYDGFISYSHAADRPLARALQRLLHRLGRPWYRPRALRVFRDDTVLAASPDLWASIERALLTSRAFVLLACPESAASPWVGREVALWRRERPREKFLIVLTGGELVWDQVAGDFDWSRTTALPEQVRGYFDAEPLWVDLRHQRDGLRRRELRDKAAAVAAGMRGVPKDQVLSEDARQQRRLVAVLASLLALALVGGAVAVWQRNTAVAQRDRADQQARVALSRALAAESEIHAQPDPQLAAQLALAAYGAAPTAEADGALLHELDRNRHVLAYLRRGTDQVSTQKAASAPVPTHVAITADGSLVGYAHYRDDAVTLWDTRQRRPVAMLRTEPPPRADRDLPSYGLAFSADGKLLAADDGVRIQLWDVPGRRLLRTLDDAGGGYRLALSPDGRWVARTGEEKRGEPPLLVWRTDTGAEVPVPAPAPAAQSTEAIFDAGSNRIYVEFPDGIRAYDLGTGGWSVTVPLPTDHPLPFALATRAARIAVLATGGVELWDLGSGRKLAGYPLAGYPPAGMSDPPSVTVSADAATVVVGDDSGRVVALDTASGRTTDLATHRAGVRDLAVSPDARLVASISENGDAVLATPVEDHRLLGVGTPPSYGTDPHGADLATVTAVAISARGDLAVVGRWGGTEVWELPAMRLRARLPLAVPPGAAGVAISPDETVLATVSHGRLTLADTRSGQVLAQATVPTELATLDGSQGVHFLPDGRRLIVDSDGGPRVLDPRRGSREQQLPAEVDGGFAANADGSVVAVVVRSLSPTVPDGGTTIEVWRWTGSEYERAGRLRESADARDVAVSQDGTRIALADIDGRVIVDDVDRPAPRAMSVAGTGAYGQAAFTPDGATLVQADLRLGGVGLWDVSAGQLLGTWQVATAEPAHGASQAALDAGTGGRVVTARQDGGVLLWQVDVGHVRQVLCAAAGELADEERIHYLQGVDVPPVCGR
jgi:WD40 repeat protein